MENHRLRVFREVVQQMNFRKAAEVLHLSQPAVSQQIRLLEEEYGARLFERDGNRISVTEAGRVLHGYALSAADLVEESRTALNALNRVVGGHLRIGASTTIAQYILPRVLGAFHRQHTEVTLAVVSGNTEEIVGSVLAESVALGMIEGPAMRRGLRIEPLLRDRMVLIASPKAPTNRKSSCGASGPISVTAFATNPLLMRERGSGSRRVVEHALKQAGTALKSLRVVMEFDSTEAIISGVEAGLGMGFVSESAVVKELRLGTIRIVKLEGVAIERDFSLIYPAGQEPTGAAEAFRRFARFDLRPRT